MFRKICNFLIGIIIAVLAVLAILLLGPRVMGYQGFAVLSGSMEPGIPVGSIVFSKEVDPATLEVGDVITYQLGSDTLVTHRITQIDEENQQVVTKGDANDSEDGSPVAYSQIAGRMDIHIPYLGYITIYIKTPVGIGVICGVLIALILLNFLPEIFSDEEEEPKKKRRKRSRKK